MTPSQNCDKKLGLAGGLDPPAPNTSTKIGGTK